MSRKPIIALILCTALAGCASPATTATPRPPATAVAVSPTASAQPSPGASATAAPTPSGTPAETPVPTPSPGVVRGQAWVPPGVTNSIVIHARAFEYAPAARPAGMDDPTAGCDASDESRRAVLLTATLRIYNRSGQTMRDWYAYFSAPSGQSLYICHQGFERMPELPSGHYVDVTFGVFMEKMERLRGYVFDRTVGRSNEIEL